MEIEGDVYMSSSFFPLIASVQLDISDSVNDYYPVGGLRSQLSDIKADSSGLIPLLGLYKALSSPEVHMLGSVFTLSSETLHSFRSSLRAVHWVTCKADFRPLFRDLKKGNNFLYSSDAWWGCALRSGQMLLLRALSIHLYMRLDSDIQLLELIQDNKINAPFALHKLCELGEVEGIKPGGFYSPAIVSAILAKGLESHPIPALKTAYFAGGTIEKDTVLSLAGHNWHNSVFIMVAVNKWSSHLSQDFFGSLKRTLDLEECVGIMNGKAKSSVFIIGYIDEYFLVLDPHHLQKACSDRDEVVKSISSYQCNDPGLLPMKKAEPCVAVGFLFKSAKSFGRFESVVKDMGKACIFEVITRATTVSPDTDEDYYII